jgi:hypothetical protein
LIDCAKGGGSTEKQGKKHKQTLWKKKGQTVERKKKQSFPQQSFSFQPELWKKYLSFGVDIRLDFLHGFRKGGVLFHLLFHLVDGV